MFKPAMFSWLIAVLAVGARAGDGFNVKIQSGRIDVTFEVYDGSGDVSYSETHSFGVTSAGVSNVLHSQVVGVEFSANICFDVSVALACYPTLSVYMEASVAAPQTGYTARAVITTGEPIRISISDWAVADLANFGGPNESIMLDGMGPDFLGLSLCPGSYEIVFHSESAIAPGEEFDVDYAYGAIDFQCSDSGVRLTGDGSIFTSGFFEDPQGKGDSSSTDGHIYSEGGFYGFVSSGDTSGGLADGYSEVSGELQNECGVTTLNVSGYARASQPAGHGWSLFVGSQGDRIELEIDEEKQFMISSSLGDSLDILPDTGQINGDRLDPGTYQISFGVGAFIGPDETYERDDYEVSLILRDPPCNDADLAFPWGTVNFDDVLVFLTAFAGGDGAADLVSPFGVWDFDDVLAFLIAFGKECP